MKRCLFAVILFLVFAASVLAAVQVAVTLAWDPMPAGETWVSVRAYEVTGVAPNLVYTKVGETTSGSISTVTIQNVPSGSHRYVVRSWTGSVESPDSNIVTAMIPIAPGNLKATVTITITGN